MPRTAAPAELNAPDISQAADSQAPKTDAADGIGERLAHFRGERGLRVSQLARQIGVSPSLISQIERGQSRPSVSTLFALAEAIGVPVDAFFGRESAESAPAGEPGESAPAAEPAASAPAAEPAASAPAAEPAASAPAAEPAASAPAVQATGAPPIVEAGESAPSDEPGDGAPAASSQPVTPYAPGAGQEPGAPPAAPPGPGGAQTRERAAQDVSGTVRAQRYVVRGDERAAIDIEGGVRWERLTPTTLDRVEFLELIYGPHAQSHESLYRHPGTEMVLLLSGRIDIYAGFERYELRPGDSMHFPSSLPHRYVNPTDEEARAVTVILHDGEPPAQSEPRRP